MDRKEAQKIVDTHVCNGCGGNLVLMLYRSDTSYRAEYGYRCLNNCDIAKVGAKKLGGLLQRYAEGNLSPRDANIIKEKIGGMVSMDENKDKAVTPQATAGERFTAIVLKEFNGLTGSTVGLTDLQKKLAQHLFVKVDVALKTFEAKRRSSGVQPFSWANVNLNKLAVDAVYRIDLGLDALIPNHIHPVPYWNETMGKYDLDLRIGYVGKDYIHRQFALDPPVNVVYELVYDTDVFAPIKTSSGSSFKFEITQPWSRGNIMGGFGYVVYDDPRKNLLVLVSEADFEKSQRLAKSQDFWENYPIEMHLKTLVHRTCDKIPLDPAKTNRSYRAVEEEEEAIEGTYHEIPMVDALPSFDGPAAVKPTPEKKLPLAEQAQAKLKDPLAIKPLVQTLDKTAIGQAADPLAKHRQSLIELAQKHLGADAYEKVLCPFSLARFNKPISELTQEELIATGKWLADEIGKQSPEPVVVTGAKTETKGDDKSQHPGEEKTKTRKKAPTETEAQPPAQTQMKSADQVRPLIKELKDKQWSDEDIKKVLREGTKSSANPDGKTRGWDNDDVPGIRKAAEEIEKKKAIAALNVKPHEEESEADRLIRENS